LSCSPAEDVQPGVVVEGRGGGLGPTPLLWWELCG